MSMADIWSNAIEQILNGTEMDNIYVDCPYCRVSTALMDCIAHIRDEHFEYYLLWIAIANPHIIDEFEEATNSYESLLDLCDSIGYIETGVSDIETVSTVHELADHEVVERCTICLDECDSSLPLRQITKCKHFYHSHCIEQWLLKKKTCPVCMQCVELDQNTQTD